MKVVMILICAALGLTISAVRADIGVVPCPPMGTLCPMGYYAPVGPAVWMCCKEAPGTCTNYVKQKMICNWRDPGDPTTYGYDIIGTINTSSYNCNPDPLNSCY